MNFNSTNAINRLADVENEYFNTISDSVSRYYGTVWRQKTESVVSKNDISQYEDYLNTLGIESIKSDSLHCTIYAYEGLKAGMSTKQLNRLEKLHSDIWKSREIAGWSIGYILVEYFDWQAYLVLDSNSNEYQHCMKSFENSKSYPVWKQPNIPLEEVFVIGEQDSFINNLLIKNEFSWGFSEQGIHTWITRYDTLKECNWLGAPSVKYMESEYEKPLFLTINFDDYFDYDSHVIIVPRKKLLQTRVKTKFTTTILSRLIFNIFFVKLLQTSTFR